MAQKWPKMAQKLAPAKKNSRDISPTFCISACSLMKHWIECRNENHKGCWRPWWSNMKTSDHCGDRLWDQFNLITTTSSWKALIIIISATIIFYNFICNGWRKAIVQSLIRSKITDCVQNTDLLNQLDCTFGTILSGFIPNLSKSSKNIELCWMFDCSC